MFSGFMGWPVSNGRVELFTFRQVCQTDEGRKGHFAPGTLRSSAHLAAITR